MSTIQGRLLCSNQQVSANRVAAVDSDYLMQKKKMDNKVTQVL